MRLAEGICTIVRVFKDQSTALLKWVETNVLVQLIDVFIMVKKQEVS